MKMYLKRLLFTLIAVGFVGCYDNPSVHNLNTSVKNQSMEYVDWHMKPRSDSLAGVNIDMANQLADSLNSSNEIIVAVIDGVVDIGHEDLKYSIYSNKDEIPNNGIDDDSNGYLDDIAGWNFLGKEDGGYVKYAPFDYLRVLKALIKKYNAHDLDSTKITDYEDRKLFQKVLAHKIGGANYGQTLIDWGEKHRSNYFKAYEIYNHLLVDGNLSLENLDSIDARNEEEKSILETLKYFKAYDITYSRINQIIEDGYARKYLVHELDFEPFNEIDSFPNNLNYTNYGNSQIGKHPERYAHGTQVAGILGAKRDNNLGIKGISNNIKIMVLEVTPTFNERPKDFINAVKYAVDNGAKIINYSGEKFMLNHKDEFNNVVDYATNNGLLFVKAAGNGGLNTDLPENVSYPSGISSDGSRMENYISVGASSQLIGKDLIPKSSNYGKNSVDIFAPGVNMRTTDVYENEYFTLGGTSLSAAVVSGIAALVWSTYPNLSASEVKQALLESGTKYDIEVETNEGMKHFSELSKTGAIVNAYDAMVLAKKMSTKKVSQ